MKWYCDPIDDTGKVYTVKIYANGAKVWWPNGEGPSKIKYANGDTILFNSITGEVQWIMTHEKQLWISKSFLNTPNDKLDKRVFDNAKILND